jgi:ribosome-binding protein aMBF1 (putative translation factor)
MEVSKSGEYACVVQEGQVAYVLVPVDEYERLIKADMVRSAVKKLDDPKTKWVDADEVALELAGQRIAQARKKAGLTQKQLADKLSIPQSQVSRIERHPDHTTVRTLKKIARALKVNVTALIE